MKLPILLISTMSVVLATDVPFVTSINSFANELYGGVLPKNHTNLVFSPFSVHTILSLLYQGAANETALALQYRLHAPQTNETALDYKDIMANLREVKKVDIQIANMMYVRTGYQFKDEFNTIAKDCFSADVRSINFSQAGAADEINAWAKEHTNSKIDKLVAQGDFDDYTLAVLLNAVYFKGGWAKKFNEIFTTKQKFYTFNDQVVECDMMFQTDDFEYGEDGLLDAKILKMKYLDERFAMVVVLPNSKTGLYELEFLLQFLDVNSLKTTKQRVDVHLPKFKVESNIRLKQPLIELGLGEIFSPSADFSNMLDVFEPVAIDKVIQKVFIEVNEAGSEAAAATVIEITNRFGDYTDTAYFNADHPFVFYITAELDNINNISTILFMGKVEQPT